MQLRLLRPLRMGPYPLETFFWWAFVWLEQFPLYPPSLKSRLRKGI